MVPLKRFTSHKTTTYLEDDEMRNMYEILLEILDELRGIRRELINIKSTLLFVLSDKNLYSTERFLTRLLKEGKDCTEAIKVLLDMNPDPILVVNGDNHFFLTSRTKIDPNDFVTLLQRYGKLREGKIELYEGEKVIEKLFEFCETARPRKS